MSREDRLRELELLELEKMRGGSPGLLAQAASIPRGFNVGLTKGLGMPVDLLTAAMNAIPGVDIQEPVGGSDWLLRQMQETGIPTQPANRLMGRVAEEIGAASVPFGLAGAAARTGMQGGLAAPILEAFRQAPRATAATELSTAAGAGLGAGLAQELAPDSAGAEMAGQVIGGMLHPAQMVRTVGGQAKRLGGAIDPMLPGGAERAAAKRLQGIVQDPKGTAAKLRAAEEIPGAELTPAQQVEDTGLARLQEAFRKTDKDVDEALTQMEKNTREAIRQEADLLAGTQKTAPKDFIQGRVNDISDQIDDTIKRANARAQNEISALGQRDGVTRETTNRLARTQLDDAYTQAKTVVDEEWGKVDFEELVSTEGLKSSYRSIVGNLSKAEAGDIPDVAKRLINDFQPEETVKELQGLRSKLLQEARNSRAGDTPNLNKARIADDLADSILRTMDNESASDQLQIAIGATNKLKDKFSKGIIGDIRKLDRTGGRAVAEAQTLEQLVRPGPVGGANFDEFMKATDNSPEAKQTVVDYLANRFVTEATNDNGRIVPAAARTFLKNHNELLNRLPELKGKIQKAKSMDDFATVTEKNLLGRKRSLLDKRKSRAALYLGGKVDQEIVNVLNSQNPVGNMKELVRITNKDLTGAAKQGLKGQFVDQIMSANNPVAFSEAHRKTMNVLFSKDELGRIDKLMDTYKRIDPRLHKGIKFDEEPDMVVDLLSRIVGANLGSMSGANTGAPLVMAGHGSRMVRKLTEKIPMQRTKDVLADAISNKDHMADLLEKVPSPKKAEKLQANLNAWMINLITDEEEDIVTPIMENIQEFGDMMTPPPL